MRVAFDTAPLVRPYPLGVRRACEGLVAELETRGVLEVVRLAPAEGEGERSWRQGRLPREAAARECAGVHSPVSAFPWRGIGRRVQTVHEVPWRHGIEENADLAHRFWAWYGPWRADAVLCPTEFVARDLRALAPLGGGRVRVCPWGVHAGPPDRAEARAGDVERLASCDPPGAPFVLCPGAVRAKKNLAAVLRGVAALREVGEAMTHVVVTGPRTGSLERDLALASRLGLERRVHAPGVVAEEELAALLGAAAAVAVLSRSEGFGFPVLEAMACGTPVLVPAASAQAEVAAEAGIEVDPEDARSVAAGLRRAARERDSLRPLLRSRTEGLSWERCARQVEALWLELS